MTEALGPGSYVITVRVTDDGSPNLSDTETITVTVNADGPPTNEKPWVNAGLDHDLTWPENIVVLRGEVQDDGLPNPALLTHVWETVMSPSGSEVDIYIDPETFEIFCPTCGDAFLVVGGTAGPNEEQTMRCPNQVCMMVWRRSNDLPPGIGLAE